MKTRTSEPVKICRGVAGGNLLPPSDDMVAVEEPLEIRVRGQAVVVTMRTPAHDAELAAGFLLSEGIVRSPGDIVTMEHCRSGEAALHGNVFNVFLAASVPFDSEALRRNVYTSSSCGLCGKASIDRVHQRFPPVATAASVTADILAALPGRLRREQEVFERTGSLHAAGLFDTEGNLLVLREDVGRHNAVDKVLGWALLRGLTPCSHHILMVSGRTSFEIVQKALSAGVPLVAAVSGPSSLAVELAVESGITLLGFLRDSRFNIYSHPGRVVPKA